MDINNLDPQTRDNLYKTWEDLFRSGKTYRNIGQEYGVDGEIIRDRLRRWRDKNYPLEPINYPRVVDEDEIGDDWQLVQNEFKKLPNVIRFAFVTDIHVPDQDNKAIELAAKIVEDFKPHVLQHGSDAFDFESISRFPVDPRKRTESVFKKIQEPYGRTMKIFNDAAPDAIKPFMMGNHDIRLYDWLGQQASMFQNDVTSLWVKLIRLNGGLFLGLNCNYYTLAHLNIIHRGGSGAYPAKTQLDKFKADTISGDLHRSSTYIETTQQRTYQSGVSGCLQNLNPTYKIGKQSNHEKWQQGIALITLDQKNQTTLIQNVVFNKKYQAAVGDKLYSVK